MQSSLNFDVNPELCTRVAAIYGFLYRKLVEVSVQREIPIIEEVLRILDIERETWRMLVEKVNRVRSDEGNRANTAEPLTKEKSAGFSAEG